VIIFFVITISTFLRFERFQRSFPVVESNAKTEKAAASADDETRAIQRVALFGFLLNLALVAVNGALAVLSGSLAVTASAIDLGTDAVASMVLYGGLKLSVRKTPTFPLGLYKIENITSVLLALFIFLAGYEIARHIFISKAQRPDISLPIIVCLLAGTVSIFLFGQYALRVSRRTESPTLKAEARHRQTDSLSSLVVLTSAVMSYFGVEFEFFGISVDQMGAALVLIFVAHTGWELLSDGMRVLLDASIDFDTLDEVRKIMESHPSVAQITSLVGRSAGRYRFLQGSVVLRTDDLEKAHRISHQIESDIRRQIPHVERVVIHYEPKTKEHTRIAVPLADDRRTLSAHFGESPYFALVLVRLADRQVEKTEILANPHSHAEKAKGILVSEWLVKQKVDEVILKSEVKHKGPGYVLSDAGVEIHLTSANHLDEAIRKALGEEDKDIGNTG
jgi:cation diffusion facilitator family transporter